MPGTTLGEFEHLVLVAILRLGDAAYAGAILDELTNEAGRAASPGAVYVTLERLEEKGLVRSRLANATAERGGRPRRYVAVTAKGLRDVRATRDTLLKFWTGAERILEQP